MFYLHTEFNAKPVFLNSSSLKSVFEKLRFRDGLVWTTGLAEELKLRFQIPPAWTGPRYRISCITCYQVVN